ncbi:hypothetical protein NM688_g3399 [Phlebia brevispora]|uniref:Uncharacterized protein n=1 Tax=Phlebia brevispora TaxID=194682 RepID=A0ACC1T603_9APHY|nr:hypothetical protein NM688_g3399 [Phlebia brevispora]
MQMFTGANEMVADTYPAPWTVTRSFYSCVAMDPMLHTDSDATPGTIIPAAGLQQSMSLGVEQGTSIQPALSVPFGRDGSLVPYTSRTADEVYTTHQSSSRVSLNEQQSQDVAVYADAMTSNVVTAARTISSRVCEGGTSETIRLVYNGEAGVPLYLGLASNLETTLQGLSDAHDRSFFAGFGEKVIYEIALQHAPSFKKQKRCRRVKRNAYFYVDRLVMVRQVAEVVRDLLKNASSCFQPIPLLYDNEAQPVIMSGAIKLEELVLLEVRKVSKATVQPVFLYQRLRVQRTPACQSESHPDWAPKPRDPHVVDPWLLSESLGFVSSLDVDLLVLAPQRRSSLPFISTMHRALYIAEIAEGIAKACLWGCYDLESNLQDAEGRATLYALARTCRALEEPALDALWSYQHGLVNLIRTMPPHLWKEEQTRSYPAGCNTDTQHWSTTQLSLTGHPKASDWTRFDYYARKVRAFGYDEALRWTDVAHNVYHALSAHRTSISSPLFPALTSLRWEADIFFPYITLFIGPSLVALTMSTVSAEARLAEVIKTLPSTCRHVRKLEVYVGSSSTMPPPSLSCWSEFKDVRGFSNGSVPISDPAEWLPWLASLPNLEDLSLSVFASAARGLSLNPPIPLPSLSRLTLFTDDISQCTRILGSCRFPSLRDVTVNAYGGVTSAIQGLSSALAQSTQPASLQSVSIYDYSPRSNSDPISTNLASLNGLLQFSNMRHIRLDVRYTVHITDSTLRLISRSWPRLESLELNWVGHCGYESRLRMPMPTLSGLVDFVASCSSLRTLSLVVDTSVTTPQRGALSKLLLGRSILDCIKAIAQILRTSSSEIVKVVDVTSIRNAGSLLQVKIGQHLCTFHDTVFHCPVYAVLFSYE